MTSLLLVTQAYAVGGLETYLAGEATDLRRRGIAVHLAVGGSTAAVPAPDPFASVTTGFGCAAPTTRVGLLAAVEVLRRIIRERQVEVVHAHPFLSLLPAALAAAAERVPFVVTLHGPDSLADHFGPLHDLLVRAFVLPGAAMVGCVSQEMAALAAPHVPAERLVVMPNAVDTARFAPSEGAGEDPRWLVAARLDQEKLPGIRDFVRAARQIGIPGVVIAGDGNAARDFAAESADVHGDFATFIGASSDMAPLMQRYAGTAGMGRVVLEALASGRPTVLVGYDTVKGVLDEDRFDLARRTNFSGRGLPDVGADALAAQLATVDASLLVALRTRVLAEHDASRMWDSFARHLESLRATPPPVVLTTLFSTLATSGRHDDLPYLQSPYVLAAVGELVHGLEHFDPRRAALYAFYRERFQGRTFDAVLAERAVTIADLTARLEASERALEAATARGDQLQGWLDDSRARVEEHATRIRLEIEVRDRRLAEGQAALDAHVHEVARLGAALDHTAERLAAASAEQHRLTDAMRVAAADLERLTAEHALTSDALATSRQQLASVLESTSWAITAPLRAVGAALPLRGASAQVRHLQRRYREHGAGWLWRLAMARALGHVRMTPYEYVFDKFVRAYRRARPVRWDRVVVPARPGLVSIVLPCYNGEDMVGEALDSLLAQTYVDIEIIAIDDGSRDGTGAILDEYARRDARIRVVHQENRKLPRSLSRGFAMAQGEFLTWTSVDNRLHPDCIERLVASLSAHPDWDMVYANIDIIGEDGAPLAGSDWYAGYQVPRGSEHVHLPQCTSELNTWANNFVGAAFLYRARVAWALGDYSANRFCTEDYDYWMRVNAVMTLRHVDFDDCVYDYRFHPASLTSRDKELGITASREQLMVFDEFRRSFLLTPTAWVVTSDGSPFGDATAARLTRVLIRQKHRILEAEALATLRLPRLWMPVAHLACGERSRPAAIPGAFQVLVAPAPVIDGDQDAWHACIAMATIDARGLPRLAGEYRGWHAIADPTDVVGFCDLRVKNTALSLIESEGAGASMLTAERPAVSVLLCTYRRSEILPACLRALFAQRIDQPFEILLINNDPADPGPRRVLDALAGEQPSSITVSIVDCPLPGLSHARNAGISEARSDVVVFVDDDAIADEYCLTSLRAAFDAAPDVAVIGGHVVLNVPSPRPDVCPEGRESLWSQYVTGYDVFTRLQHWWEFPYGALWAARRDVLVRIGGFRCNFGRIGTNFGGGEEIVAALLAQRLGHGVGVEPQARVLHDVAPERYTRTHVVETIKAALVTNYEMQVSLYRPIEDALPGVARHLVSAQVHSLRTRLQAVVARKDGSAGSLYATAYARAAAKLFVAKLADVFGRFRRPTVCP